MPLRTAIGFACVCLAAAATRAEEPAPGSPAGPPAAHVRIEKDRLIFNQIRDDTPFTTEEQNRDEYAAYNTVLLHARQFPAAELEKHARRDVTFKDLFRNADEFRLELVYLEGRLRQLRRTEPTADLKAAGVADLYEGWLFPTGERDPVVVLVTELPPGLEAQTDLRAEMDRRVAFAGYSFKLFRYESREVDARNPKRNVHRRAPLLMGRALTPLAEPAADGPSPWLTTFLPAALVGLGGLAAMIVVLTWYFRRGDRAFRAAAEARRDRNPFSE